MSGNLTQLEKALRKIAKHSKSIKYTKGLLFVFLMTGMMSFSAEVTVKDKEIEQTKVEINDTVKEVKDQFRIARIENEKLLRNANLDLIQLMEQGDQVIKSPWSSWQFGVNYMYDGYLNSGESYRGRGDKETYEEAGFYDEYKRDPWWISAISKSNPSYSKLTSKSDVNSATSVYRNGLLNEGYVNLNIKDKPLSEIDLSAQVATKAITKQAPKITVTSQSISNLIINAPQQLNVTPNIIMSIKQPSKPNLNPTININPSINPTFSVTSPSGINFNFSAGHNASAPLRLGSGSFESSNPPNHISSLKYTRNYTLNNAFHFVNWEGGETYFSQATIMNVTAINSSTATSVGRFFAENGGSSKILANYGKISITSGSSDAFIFGDTVDQVLEGTSPFSTSVYNSGIMSINADSPNGQKGIPAGIGMAYLSNGDDGIGNGAKQRYLVNGINGVMEIN